MVAAWLAMLAAIVVTLAGFAHWQVTHELDVRAQQRILASTSELPIARWSMTNADDIIAGRVFGDADTRFDEAGLHVTSRGVAVEFGIRLDGPLDLARFGLVSVAVDSDVGSRFQWSVYFQDSTTPCRSEPLTVVDGRIVSRLDQIAWQCKLPSRPAAISLRIVVDARRGASVTFRDFSLSPVVALQLPEPDSIPLVAPGDDLVNAESRLDTLPNSIQPLVIVQPEWRDAATLRLREDLRSAVPAVVAISGAGVANASPASKSLTFNATWLLLALLVVAWLRPPKSPRWRVVARVGAALLMPLWLSVGLRLGTSFSFVDCSFVAAGVIYLGVLIWQRGQPWKWIGKPAAWLIPTASVAMTLVLAMLIPRENGPEVPDSIAALRYLGWAAIQQMIVLRIVADRIAGLGWSAKWVSLSAASAFALLHAPNQALMLLTLGGGLLWNWNWQRHRALLPNVVAHALCGLIASAAIDRSWLWSAEIGSRFFAG
ncbi:MAG: CPBP family glutamic-type intramembrane protease [Dokdonella sp.]